MIPAGALILLDTTILLPLLRGGAAGEELLSRYGFQGRPERPLVCSVSLGEVRRMANRRNWGTKRIRQLDQLRENLVVVDVGAEEVHRAYGELGAFADRAGRKLSDNDVWIAAATQVSRATLLTADRDFDVYHPRFITREFVDPKSLPRQ